MKVIRKIGIGDLQHVRGELLSIGFMTAPHMEAQLVGACTAGSQLTMMMRAHVACQLEHERAHQATVTRHAHHQILCYAAPGLPAHIIDYCDMLIEVGPEEVVTANDVECAIIETWNRHGGRFTGGNFGGLDSLTLQRMYLP